MPPSTGATPQLFNFDGFVISRAIYEVIERETPDNSAERPERVEVGLQVGAQIRMHPDENKATVVLDFHVTPDRKWQPYRIQVTIAGGFRAVSASREQLEQFCRLGVPSILYPYVRERVHHLTMDAPFGFVRLDPVNISEMLNQSEWTTVGLDAPSDPSIAP